MLLIHASPLLYLNATPILSWSLVLLFILFMFMLTHLCLTWPSSLRIVMSLENHHLISWKEFFTGLSAQYLWQSFISLWKDYLFATMVTWGHLKNVTEYTNFNACKLGAWLAMWLISQDDIFISDAWLKFCPLPYLVVQIKIYWWSSCKV